MRRPAVLLTALGLLLVFGFMGWSLYAANRMGGSWTGGSPLLAMIIVLGVVGACALAGVLMWLAFYSARKGYDDAAAHFLEDDEP